MAKENNTLPVDLDTQLKNMKLYVHFTKRSRMASFLKQVGYFRGSRYAKFLISHTNEIRMKPTQDMLFLLYEFDTKLQEILFRYCRISEIRFKAILADSVSLKLNTSSFYLLQQYYTPSRSERDKIKKRANIHFFKIFFYHLSQEADYLLKNKKKYPELKEYRSGGAKETETLPCWVFFHYAELGTIINIFAYLRGDLRSHVLQFSYSQKRYGKNTTKQFDTWLEALRNLRNTCAHHNILVGKTSSIVLPENTDKETLLHDTDLFSRLYALKKILPVSEHIPLKHDIFTLIKHSKLNISALGILPPDWESRYDNITVL